MASVTRDNFDVLRYGLFMIHFLVSGRSYASPFNKYMCGNVRKICVGGNERMSGKILHSVEFVVVLLCIYYISHSLSIGFPLFYY